MSENWWRQGTRERQNVILSPVNRYPVKEIRKSQVGEEELQVSNNLEIDNISVNRRYNVNTGWKRSVQWYLDTIIRGTRAVWCKVCAVWLPNELQEYYKYWIPLVNAKINIGTGQKKAKAKI